MYEPRAFKLRAIFKSAPPFTFSWAFLGPLPPSRDVHTSSSWQISVGSLGPLWSLLCMCTTSSQLTVCKDLSSILSLSHLPEVSAKSMASLSVYHFWQTGLQLQVCRARDTSSPISPPHPTHPPSRAMNIFTFPNSPPSQLSFLGSSSEAAGFYSLPCPGWTTLPTELRKENGSSTRHKHQRLTLFLPKAQLFAQINTSQFADCF